MPFNLRWDALTSESYDVQIARVCLKAGFPRQLKIGMFIVSVSIGEAEHFPCLTTGTELRFPFNNSLTVSTDDYIPGGTNMGPIRKIVVLYKPEMFMRSEQEIQKPSCDNGFGSESQSD